MKQNLRRASNQSCSDVRLQIGHQSQETAAGTENRSDRTLGGVATVFHSATPPIHSRSAHSTSKKTGACNLHAPHSPSAAAANDTSPEMPLAAATASNQGFTRLGNSPAARPSDRPLLPLPPRLTFHGPCRKLPIRVSIGSKKWPVSPFVVVSCPAPPVTRQRAATALPRHRPGSHAVLTTPAPGSYSGPTPRVEHFLVVECRYAAAAYAAADDRLAWTIQKHPPDHRRAPATKPAARLLPALVMHFASWVTWLEGVIPQASGRMCGLPPAIVSANWQNANFGHFGG